MMIEYTRDLDIRNTEHLPRGTGCRYLLCLLAHDGKTLIAKSRHRKPPKNVGDDERVVVFGSVT